jgi:hypothetical protein
MEFRNCKCVVTENALPDNVPELQEGNNVQDGRSENEVSKTEVEAIAAQYDRLKSLIPSQVEVADPNAEKLDDDAIEEAPSQSDQAPAETEEIQVAPIQTEEPEVTPTETEESEVAPPQTEESEKAPAQTEVVEKAPAQTEELEEDPAQTEEVEEDPAQTEEVEVAPAQTEEVEEDPAQTEEAEVAPAQTEEVVKAPAQTEEVVKAPAQTEEVVKAPAQTKESEVAPARTEQSEVAPARTEELEVAPARTEVSVDTTAGDSESKRPTESKAEEAPAEVKETPVQTREAPARTEEKVEAPVRTEEKVEAPVQTAVESSHSEVLTIENARQEATRNPDSGKTEEEEDAAPVTKRTEEEEELAPVVDDENPSGIDAARVPFIMGNKTHLAGTDKWKLGPLGSDLKFLEETIRSKMLPYTTRKGAEHEGCDGKYMYVYELPEEYNKELAARCETLFPWFSLCPYVVDSGRGVPVNAVDNGTQIFVPGDKWFNTHQYALEMVSHARALKYKCRTWDREKANLFYIPYYAGLDVVQWHFDPKTTNDAKDALSLKLVGWLKQQKEFVRRGGRDHVLVLGKISWDFRRQPGASWGSRMLEFPELKDMTRLMIERDPWCKYDIGVPHPTYFHPTSAADIDQWLAHVRAQKRTYLVTFVGKERKNDPKNPRTALVRQCLNVTSADDCKFVECDRSNCLHPAFVTRAFLATHFCMQPVGDSPTRRSVFDSLIAGCIPVLFHPQTAYTQYPWHLPRNESLYSVYIPEEDVIKGTVSVVDELKKITVAQRDAMREYIINTMIPGLIYSAPGADVSPYRDAFDISIDQVLHRSKLSLGMDDSH